MRVGRGSRVWTAVLLGGVLVLPMMAADAPEVAQAAEPTVVSALELPNRLQVGQHGSDRVTVSGPVGRPVHVQFRTAGTPWRTAVTLTTKTRHELPVEVAVTTPGGWLVWQVLQRRRGCSTGCREVWAVAGRTDDPVGEWRVRVPAVPGWARAVTPAERIQVVRFPRWIRRVDVSSTGAQANDYTFGAALSADGRFVAFHSYASNLVSDDTNGVADVFVHERATGQTSRVSVSSTGEQSNEDWSGYETISDDGRHVAFGSDASSLVPGDTNGARDIFVHDRATGQTSRVTVTSTGGQANGPSLFSTISADGRYVAFASDASNLVRRDTNGERDVFVHDRVTGQTTRVSVSSTGRQANRDSSDPEVSADGRYVAYVSWASNLVPADTNQWNDVFVHDRVTGQTSRVSVSSTGAQATRGSWPGAISHDGRYVAFDSSASNLVGGDTNGAGDVFVHDRMTGRTSRVSASSTGGQSDGSSHYGEVSPDGRYVAFESYATNLVRLQAASTSTSIMLHDRTTGRTRLIGPASDGDISLSEGGRFVATDVPQSFLVAGDTNGATDVFLARLKY